jgi:chromosome segregation ATPase
MTSRRYRTVGLALGVALCTTAAAWSAPPGPRDPDWPCQQIKVPQLSLAAVWSGPAVDRQREDWRQDQQVVDMVQTMAQRRVPIEQAQDKLHAFAAQAGDQKQTQLLELLAGLFSMLNDERSTVIAGLDRFGVRQKELAAELRNANEKLRAMQADPAAKASDVDQMTQRITWEAQVFQDRRQALSYACDVPGKIEQRLFALARTIQEALQ